MVEEVKTTQCGNEKCVCNCKNSFSLEGNSGDLYINEQEYREISVVQPINESDDSYVGMSLHSIDRSGKHETLNEYLNKKVKFTVSIMDE